MTRPRPVLVVTGASRNLGAASAMRMATEGYDLVLTARASGDDLERVAVRCRGAGAAVDTVLGDLSDEYFAAMLAERVAQRYGGLYGYVANAAVRPKATLDDLPIAEWHRVIDVDLTAALLLAQCLTPLMSGAGRIVHTSGLTGWIGSADGAHVAAAKAGLHGLTRALAVELGPRGITVNTIVPAAFDTVRDDQSSEGRNVEGLLERIPVGRLGRPEEYAALCAYLLSPEAAFMTGQALHLNGGYRIG